MLTVLSAIVLLGLGLAVAGDLSFNGEPRKGAYVLVYPILWVAGLFMWLGIIALNWMTPDIQNKRPK